MGELAQAFVQCAEPGVDVVEAPVHALLVVGGDDGRNLGRCLTELIRQRDDLLQGPVVQVETEAH